VVAADGERTEFLEEPDPVGDLSGVGWVDEREPGDITQAQGGHLEDDRGQRGALDLGLGELGAGLEVLLGVQPDAHAGGDAAAPTGALRALAWLTGSIGSRCTLVRWLYREMRAVPVSTT
jgi:hypothetical protein